MYTNPLELPLPVVVDNLLPLLSNHDLATLRCVSKQAKALVEDEVLWKRKVLCDFTFPAHATARVGGWFNLYRGLSNPHVYVWGQTNNYRLGVDMATLDPAVVRDAAFIREGIPYPIRLNTISQSNARTGATDEQDVGAVVEIVAGGWAFHARTSKGRVWYWGTMDGETFAGHQTTWRDPGKPIQTPQLMHDIPAVSSLSGGRSHVAALTQDHEILEWRAWGTVWKLQGLPPSITEPAKPSAHAEASSLPEAVPARSNIKQLEAGWSFTTVLTHTGEIWLWYSDWAADAFVRSYYGGHAREAMMHADPPGHADQRVFPLTITPVQLPAIGSSAAEQGQQDDNAKVVQIAAGEDFILALTAAGTVHMLDLHLPAPTGDEWAVLRQAQELRTEPDDHDLQAVMHRLRLTRFVASRAHWQRLCAFERPQELAGFDARWLHGQRGGLGTVGRITHVSAHFRRFVVFLAIVPPDQQQQQQEGEEGEEGETLVLLGDVGGEGGGLQPELIPELQARGVIKVSMGDYHYGALTQRGEILTWGAFSKGALGNWSPPWIGAHQSEEQPDDDDDDEGEEGERSWLSNLIPLPRVFLPQQPRIGFAGRGARPRAAWTSSARSRHTHRRGHTLHDVARPTLIHIHPHPPSQDSAQEHARHPFAFDLAFAGWHSSALVMDASTPPPSNT